MYLNEITNIDPKTQLHKRLNLDLWIRKGKGNYKLKPIVSKTLKEIAVSFFKYLDIPAECIEGVMLTGSNCNYNWTPWSDIDVHLIVNFKKLGVTPEEFAEKYFKSAKSLWNQEHDIKIGDYDVELYAQDSEEKHVASGTYSLSDGEWIQKPKPVHVTINDRAVKSKAVEIANLIDQLADMKSTDPDPAEELKVKIRRLRRAGLSKHGEFSVENLVFKALRNNGYLDKLDKIYKGATSKKLSITVAELKAKSSE